MELLTITEIENSLKTKDRAYMLVTTESVDNENIVALFMPIALNINLTTRKRYRLCKQKRFLSTNLEKAHKENKLLLMKLCWANNISRDGIYNVIDAQKMQPTQIDVEKHLFEVMGDNYPGEKHV